MNLNQVTLPALDIEASIDFYIRMGFEPIVLAGHYARFKSTEGETTFSIHKIDALGNPSPTVVYFECSDLAATVDRLRSLGFSFKTQITDEPWLWTEARLLDPCENEICLYFAGENRLNPPWRVR